MDTIEMRIRLRIRELQDEIKHFNWLAQNRRNYHHGRRHHTIRNLAVNLELYRLLFKREYKE